MQRLAELWSIYGNPLEKKVKCMVCSRYCVIAPNMRGNCQTRQNIDGKLYTLVYGSCISSGSIDPIEKKPLYHFWPGSNAYSIATIGCNFHCKHCQNWEISQSYPDESGNSAEFSIKDKQEYGARSFYLKQMRPEEIVLNAKKSNSTSIAYTYNEPTIWYEFVKDTAILAHKEEIKNVLVSNGYSSLESNRDFINYIDAANIDIKAFSDKFYKEIVGIPSLQPVLDTCTYFKNNGVHLEITNLIIPNENDDIEEIHQMIIWIKENLGKDTPLHFSAYRPHYKLDQPSTSMKILNESYRTAKREGLENVYVGNVISDEMSDTICPSCGVTVIKRSGYHIINENLSSSNSCANCDTKISLEGKFISSRKTHFF